MRGATRDERLTRKRAIFFPFTPPPQRDGGATYNVRVVFIPFFLFLSFPPHIAVQQRSVQLLSISNCSTLSFAPLREAQPCRQELRPQLCYFSFPPSRRDTGLSFSLPFSSPFLTFNCSTEWFFCGGNFKLRKIFCFFGRPGLPSAPRLAARPGLRKENAGGGSPRGRRPGAHAFLPRPLPYAGAPAFRPRVLTPHSTAKKRRQNTDQKSRAPAPVALGFLAAAKSPFAII